MRLVAPLAPDARSARSTTATDQPWRAASRAVARPTMPPPTTSTSSGSLTRGSLASAASVPARPPRRWPQRATPHASVAGRLVQAPVPGNRARRLRDLPLRDRGTHRGGGVAHQEVPAAHVEVPWIPREDLA